VLTFDKPTSMMASLIFTIGPRKSAWTWKDTGGPSSISMKK